MSRDGNDLLKAVCLSDILNFTKYHFWRQNKHKFITNHHHRLICDKLNAVVEGKITRLIINVAPRFSKTELAVKNFIAAGFAYNPASKFIHLSYSDDLANDNSEAIRNLIKSEHYRQLYPYVEVSKTTDSKKKWNTTSGGGLYAVSTGGQVTGFGAGGIAVEDSDESIRLLAELQGEVASLDNSSGATFKGAIVIDDPIKPEDALSDVKREAVNLRFETTIRSRVNSRNTPIIIIMQRLHENDLCGYLLKNEPEEWEVLSLPCIYEEDGVEKPLWEFKHTLEELYQIKANNNFVFETQYMQNPRPLEGLMYERGFKTYKELPPYHGGKIKAYTDTADTGKDFLCSIVYVETRACNYVLDVVYTQDSMEKTEQEVAYLMNKYNVRESVIESNNGGRGFRRNVERICREAGNGKTVFKDFHQSKNKDTRILTYSSEVQNLVLFPEGWENLFPKFHNDLVGYSKVGKNLHDDAPDALTGTVEQRSRVANVDLNALRRSIL